MAGEASYSSGKLSETTRQPLASVATSCETADCRTADQCDWTPRPGTGRLKYQVMPALTTCPACVSVPET